MMRKFIPFTVASLLFAAPLHRTPEIPFARHTIDLGANEPSAIADVNKDGKLDIISGENWYEAPKWTQHKFRSLDYQNNYIDNFTDIAIDVDGDGWVDVISCTYFSKRLSWWKNPGRAASGEWKENVIDNAGSGEFVFLADLNNDGKAEELLPQYGQPNAPLTWYEHKNGGYVKHVVSPKSYGHGIGAGDVNGDGKTDILTPKGWFEAPDWKWHPDFDLGSVGFMYVLDVNGDGKNDIVTSMAHDYGVFWLERGDGATWTKRVIDDSWSQAHALTLVDLNGDGRKDILTGKRYMAHNGKDPGEREPLGIYWYETLKAENGKIDWVKHTIEYGGRVGTGMQIPVADIDGDGDLDFAVAGKSGVFLFENLTKKR